MMKKIMTVTLNPCIDQTITVENFVEGGLNRVKEVRIDAGGKGVNVAKVLKRMEAAVLAVGVLGDEGGDRLLSELKVREIPADFLSVSGTTRTNYKLFDRKKRQVTEINEPGFSVTSQEVQKVFSLIEKHLPETEILVLAGSLAPGFAKDTYRELVRLAKAYDTKVIVDADGESFSLALEAAPYAVKPNRFELEQFYGKTLPDDESLIACGKALLEKGISLVVISLGGEGSLYLTQEETIRVTLEPTNCQSTVGAGDSMVAAIAGSLARQTDLISLAKMASAAGTATAAKPGSEVCTMDDILEYQETVIATRLS